MSHSWQRAVRVRKERAAKARRRTLALGVERLEARLPLAQDVLSAITGGPNWFQHVSPPTQSGQSWVLDDAGPAQEWIVSLNDHALARAPHPSAAKTLLNPATVLQPGQPSARVQVLRGLGLPGQLLVEVRGSKMLDVGQFLAANPFINSATSNHSVAGQEFPRPNDPEFDNQAHLDQAGAAHIHVREAWDTTTGTADVIVAIVDSGIDLAHRDLYRNIWLNPGEIPSALRTALADPDANGQVTLRELNLAANASSVTDFNGNAYIDAADILNDPRWIDRSDGDNNGFVDDLFGWDFVNNDNNPLDDHGHGTHVAGILGAEGNNGVGVTGVAWQSSLLPVKFLNDSNVGDTANAIAATNYLTSLRTRVAPSIDSLAGPVNVRVANNSWGVGSGTGDVSLRNSIAAAGDAGILFVAGAGNGDILGRGIDLDTTPFFPASYDLANIISVAASDSADSLTQFSNFGQTSIDIVAPGEGILSTERGDAYGTRNGTSMAVPQVTGVAALVFAVHPDASVAEVRNAILSGADPIAGLTDRVNSGGRLNAAGALSAQVFAPQSALTSALPITAESSDAESLTVRFSDTNMIDVSSYDDDDIFVTRIGFGSTVLEARFDEVTPAVNATTHDVTYSVLPNDGSWDALDSGVYEVKLRGGQVRNVSGVFSQSKTLGTFRVEITDADVFIVNSSADSVDATPGDGSAEDAQGRTTLRAAIMEANLLPGEQSIVLPEGFYRFNANLAGQGDLDILGDLLILGTIPTGLEPPATVIDAQKLDRVFDIAQSANVLLSGLSITGGLAETGGAIRNAGNLTVKGSRITGNIAGSAGGAIENQGDLDLRTSWIDQNQTTESGEAGGGGLYNTGNVSIDASTFSSNRTAAGVLGNAGGGAIHNTALGTIAIVNSTISGNTATKGHGGGIYTAGAFNLSSVTVTENTATAGLGGGIYNESTNQNVEFESKFATNGPAENEFADIRGLASDSQGNLFVADFTNSKIRVFDAAGLPSFSFGEFGFEPGQLRRPTAVAVDASGTIYVADRKVKAFDADGAFKFELTEPFLPGAMTGDNAVPGGIAVGPGNRLYIYRRGSSEAKVFVFEDSGQFLKSINAPLLAVQGMAIDASENIYLVAQNATGRILDKNGISIGTFGTVGVGDPTKLSSPGGVVLGSGGQIYVSESANGSIQEYSAAGALVRHTPGLSPTGIAVGSSGNIRVFDATTKQLRTFSAAGAPLASFGRPDNNLFPRGIAVDSDGRTFVADTENHRIEIYAPDRTLEMRFGGFGTGNGQFNLPQAIEIDENQNIIVADTGNRRLQLFDSDGTFVRVIGTGALTPAGLAAGSDDRIYASDAIANKIFIYNSRTGSLLSSFGQTGSDDGELQAPRGIAFDSAGQLYVADSGNSRVQIFDADGVFVEEFHRPSVTDYLPYDIDFDASGIAFIADLNTNRVFAFDPLDTFTFFPEEASFSFALGGAGRLDGQFLQPTNVEFDALGRIYVAEQGTDRLQVFAPVENPLVFFDNTYLANNFAVSSPDVHGSYSEGSSSRNLIGDPFADLAFLGFAGLAPLKVTRGFIPVHVPLPVLFSSVINQGDTNLGKDQLGNPRPNEDFDFDEFNLENDFEIGAVERYDIEINGRIFEDNNGDGVQQANEAGLAGVKVFVDENLNGFLDPSEIQTVTLADDPATPLLFETGQYSFVNAPGIYRVVVVPPRQYEPTSSQFVPGDAALTTNRLVATSAALGGLGGDSLAFLRGATIDGRDVVFAGSQTSLTTPVPNSNLRIGSGKLYHVDASSNVTALAQIWANPTAPFSGDYVESFDAGQVLVQADEFDSSGRLPGLYLVNRDGEVKKIMDVNTPIPSGSENFGERFPVDARTSEGLVSFSVDGLVYSGSSESSLVLVQAPVFPSDEIGFAFIGERDGILGIYETTSGADRVVADTDTIDPNGDGPFSSFSSLSRDGGVIAFIGVDANGREGIYLEISGQLRKLVHSTDMLDGQQLASLELSRDAVSGNRVVFVATFEDDSAAIYVATIDQAASRTVRGNAGEQRNNIDFAMRPQDGTLGGVVFEDSNADGIRSTSEPGMSGWTVFLDQNKNSQLDLNEPQQLTAAGGTYRFDDLGGNQTYRVGVIVQAGFEATSPSATPGFRTVLIGAAQELTSASLGIRRSLTSTGVSADGILRGQIFADQNSNAKRDAGEVGLPGLTVYIDANSNGSFDPGERNTETTPDNPATPGTNEAGSYEFRSLARSTGLVVRVVTPEGSQQTTPRDNAFLDSELLHGITPQDVLSADFNNDGAPDLALANSETNEVQVLLNTKTTDSQQGTGRFTARAPVTRLNKPVALASGDFNGDGRADLVVANQVKQFANVLLNKAGAATSFDPPLSLDVGLFQADVLVARLDNNDTRDDIVFLLEQRQSSLQGQVVILRGKGNGQFETAVKIDVGPLARSIAASDLDGDGDRDLVVVSTGDSTLQVLRNDNGTFVKQTPIALAQRPYFVTAEDLSGDGKPDLVTANLENNTLSVLKNISTAMAVAFDIPQSVGTNTGPQSISTVDIDMDNDFDLVVADGSAKNATVLRNRGQGDFAAPESVGIALLSGGIGRSLVTADLNSDGLAEIVVARGDNNLKVTGEFAGNVSLFTNQLAAGANRAALANGNETITALDFGLQVPAPPAVRPWFNEPRPQDVNNDTRFTVVDAVAVINFLNSAPPGTISIVPANAQVGTPFGFIDTDGNNIISVNDALRVINRLNSPGADGEGESDSDSDRSDSDEAPQ